MEFHSPSSAASSSSSSSSSSPSAPKRKAGRKKFRETRHPVYRGVRERNGGRWVSEVRDPRRGGRISVGTFQTPEMAAVALRGDSAQLNFPDSAWVLPRAISAAADDVGRAATDAAEMFRPSNSSSTPTSGPTAGGCPGSDGRESEAAAEAATAPPAPVFVDEEALFNMPGLLEDMARGLLVTPPAMQRGFDWEDGDECVMDLSLWTY